MKTMKILILHTFFNDFGENPAAVSNQPGARQATSGPRERETKREPFAVAFGKNHRKTKKTNHPANFRWVDFRLKSLKNICKINIFMLFMIT